MVAELSGGHGVLRVDAHQHFWDLATGRYPEWRDGPAVLARSFHPDDLEPELRVAGVAATVLVQAAASLQETEGMLALADGVPWIRGVVGWVPLASPALSGPALAQFCRHSAFRGIRHFFHDDLRSGESIPWLSSLGFVAERGLACDLLVAGPAQLAQVADIARRYPDLHIVIDHLGHPPIRTGEWSPWAEALREAAGAPNVFAKLSGLGTLADAEWSVGDIRPYVNHAIEVFGPRRLMLGSDWPVCLLAGTYADTTARLLGSIDGLSKVDQEWVLGRTAMTAYGLQATASTGGATA